MRPIDADTLIAYIKKRIRNEMVIAWLCRIIGEAPTIEAEPVRHGRWERGDNFKPKCSVCGEFHLYAWPDHKKCKYCPNCGAKMDLKGE